MVASFPAGAATRQVDVCIGFVVVLELLQCCEGMVQSLEGKR
jgi:hypothetical protein